MAPVLLRLAPGKKAVQAFTLVEVVIAFGIMSVMIEGLIYGYVASARRAEWAAHDLAAQSLAAQGVEQCRAAKWDPQAWPIVDDLPPTNYTQVQPLDLPVSGSPEYATNIITVSVISTNPVLRQIRADCVWRFTTRGLFTNTAISLRAPDQ